MTIRRTALAAALISLVAVPALAQTPFSCRIGPYAKESHLLAEHFDMVVRAEPRAEARTEYRVTVRNPHPWPAAVLTGIDMPGLVEAPAEPVTIPARGTAELVIGWFPLTMPVRRMAPPLIDEVRGNMTVPLCQVMRPDMPAPSANRPVPPSGLEVVRNEGPRQFGQRL